MKILEERLEMMRSLEGKPVEECRPLADETLQKYGPMAEEMGLSAIQHELEELSVKFGYPEEYREIKRLLMESEALCETTFKTFTMPIRSMLDSVGYRYSLKFRMKSVYSIWRKIRVGQKSFDDVYDLFGARIVYEPGTANLENLIQGSKALGRELDASFLDQEKLDCWRIYTIITSLYRVHPDRIKDWVTNPKPSGYQALQITVMGPDCNWFEIQIRSKRMDYEAEEGIAAHWKYKRETKAM